MVLIIHPFCIHSLCNVNLKLSIRKWSLFPYSWILAAIVTCFGQRVWPKWQTGYQSRAQKTVHTSIPFIGTMPSYQQNNPMMAFCAMRDNDSVNPVAPANSQSAVRYVSEAILDKSATSWLQLTADTWASPGQLNQVCSGPAELPIWLEETKAIKSTYSFKPLSFREPFKSLSFSHS